jgi:integrase
VSSAFARGVKWGIATANPVSNSDLPPTIRKEGIAFSIDEQSLLLQAAHAHWALPMILEISAATGARRGEVLALRWSDMANGKVSVLRSLSQTKAGLFFKTTKNKKGRTVSLPASTIPLLQEHRAHQEVFRRQFGPDYKSDLDLVFANPDGSPLLPDSISAAASALCRRIKLPKGTSLHTLRHSHGSHLLAAGMELPAVSARLGHSNPYVTATVYAHVLTGRDDEAAKIWDEFQKRKAGKTTARGEEPKLV